MIAQMAAARGSRPPGYEMSLMRDLPTGDRYAQIDLISALERRTAETAPTAPNGGSVRRTVVITDHAA